MLDFNNILHKWSEFAVKSNRRWKIMLLNRPSVVLIDQVLLLSGRFNLNVIRNKNLTTVNSSDERPLLNNDALLHLLLRRNRHLRRVVLVLQDFGLYLLCEQIEPLA